MSADVRPGEHLSLEQRKAIDALASGATLDQAAVIADRTPHTLRRWRRDDEAYAAALKKAADEALEDAAVQLKGLLKMALDRLAGVLANEEAKGHVLMRAIDMTLSHGVKLTEYAELEDRVRALEEKVN